MPQDDPKKRAALARIKAILGFDAAYTVEDLPGARQGEFDFKTGNIFIDPETRLGTWANVHEGEHARRYEQTGLIGKAYQRFRAQMSNLNNDSEIDWPIWVEGMERGADNAAAAYTIMKKINQMLDPETAARHLDWEIESARPVSNVVPWLNRDDILEKIQEYSRHQSNRGSMIRRALLASGRELR